MSRMLEICVVDDEFVVRVALRRLLGAYGLRVREFPAAPDFLAALPGLRVDCLILDLHMPGMTGQDLLHRLAIVAPQLPTIVVTGREEPGVRERSLAAGARAFLTKPIDIDELLAEIWRVSARERG